MFIAVLNCHTGGQNEKQAVIMAHNFQTAFPQRHSGCCTSIHMQKNDVVMLRIFQKRDVLTAEVYYKSKMKHMAGFAHFLYKHRCTDSLTKT